VNDPAIRRVLAVFSLITAILIFVAVMAVRNINHAAAANDWVNHTHAVILETGEILSTARAGAGALRAYAIGGDSGDREAAREALAELAEHVEVAKALTRAESAEEAQVQRLETLAGQLDALGTAVLAARTAEQSADLPALLARPEWRVTAEIRRVVAKLRDDQMTVLADRDRASYLQAQTTRWTVWSGVALNFLLLAGSAWLIRDDIAARRRAAAVLQEANEQLEARVRERTAELAAANQQLKSENLERRWANEALEHQIRYNQVIVDSIGDAVFVLTKSLNISRINPAVVHLTGLDAPKLVNRPLSSVVRRVAGDASAGAPLFDPLQQALREGRDLRDLPGEAQDKFGQTKSVRFSLFPLRDRDKVVGGVVIVHAERPAPAMA
jgi:PAS domain-containing protein